MTEFKRANQVNWRLEYPTIEESELEQRLSELAQHRLSAKNAELENHSYWTQLPTEEESVLEKRIAEMKRLREYQKSTPWSNLAGIMSIAFGIPLITLIIGSAVVWALAGFRPPDSNGPASQ